MPDFFEQPILNSPYAPPARRWELDDRRQPTDRVVEGRRPAEFIAPVPKPRRRGGQRELAFGGGEGQQYELTARINEMRRRVGAWRALPDRASWQVTPETARLLAHWRTHDFRGPRPFFCQIEAVETLIWLTEVAPKRRDREARELLRALERASEEANPGLSRLALKLATGAGKTTVMAMIVAWQTVNAVRRPGSPHFTRGFLVVTPGITIRDRLRVLQPHAPDSYYRERELVPHDMLPDLAQARPAEDIAAQADFYYERAGGNGACVFVDGPVHDDPALGEADRRKGEKLEEGGYRVVRITHARPLEQQIAEHSDVFGPPPSQPQS